MIVKLGCLHGVLANSAGVGFTRILALNNNYKVFVINIKQLYVVSVCVSDLHLAIT